MNIRIAYAAKIAVLLILLGLGVAKGAEVTKESYTITMKDGTVLVGAVQINRVKFNASYGSVDVSLGEILTFNDGFLTLADGTKLKGTFPSGSLDLVTTRGTLNLMFESIVSIAKASAVATTPATATTAASGPPAASTVSAANLVGKVIDCFGKALPGASVMVKNSRFVTTTDNQGNYSLGYVPGKIQVSFTKQGYYETGLTFEISAPAAYPVQDLCMFKVLPSQGILFIGDTDYIKSTSSVNIKQRQGSGPASRQEMEYDYYVTGQPVALAGLHADLSFVINAPNRSAITGMTTADPNLGVALFRVQPGGLFFRKTEAGFGGVLGSQSSGERLKVGTVSGVGDMFRLWKGRLDPGLYALTMEVEDMGGGSFGDPCFFFQVTSPTPNGTAETRTQPPAQRNSSGSSPTANSQETHAQPPPQRTPFEELTFSVPQANLFQNNVKDFAFPYDKVWDAVSKVLTEQKENVTKSDMEKGILMTDVTKHGVLGFGNYDQYCLLLERVNDTSTRVNLKLLRFELAVAGQKVPSDQDAVTSKAQAFLDKISTKLQTGK
jgi:hypothetical protein